MSDSDGGRIRYVWVGPFIGFLAYVTGLMAEEVIDPVTAWLRQRSTPVISAIVIALAALVIWIIARRERTRRRRIEAIRSRIAAEAP